MLASFSVKNTKYMFWYFPPKVDISFVEDCLRDVTTIKKCIKHQKTIWWYFWWFVEWWKWVWRTFYRHRARTKCCGCSNKGGSKASIFIKRLRESFVSWPRGRSGVTVPNQHFKASKNLQSETCLGNKNRSAFGICLASAEKQKGSWTESWCLWIGGFVNI